MRKTVPVSSVEMKEFLMCDKSQNLLSYKAMLSLDCKPLSLLLLSFVFVLMLQSRGTADQSCNDFTDT